MSSTRIGEKNRLYLYINHKRGDVYTLYLEIFEPEGSVTDSIIFTDLDDFLNLINLFAAEVNCKSESKRLTDKIMNRMLKKHNYGPESIKPPRMD